MKGFSATDAIGSGFRLIRREPVALLVWSLAYLVLGVLPSMAAMASLLPDMVALYQDTARRTLEGVTAPNADLAMAMQSKMTVVQPLIWLAMIASQTVLTGAIYRAVLQPEDRRYFYLRLSRQELWLVLTWLVLLALLFIMIFVLVIPIAIGAAAMAAAARHSAGGAGAAGLVLGLIGVAGCAAIVWVLVRLSLAPLMSFAQRRFLLSESWSLTRGQALKMFLVMLALVVTVWVLEMVLLGLGGLVGLAGFPGGWRALLDTPPAELARKLRPWIVIWSLVAAPLGVAIYTLFAAPLAEIYKQLTAEPA